MLDGDFFGTQECANETFTAVQHHGGNRSCHSNTMGLISEACEIPHKIYDLIGYIIANSRVSLRDKDFVLRYTRSQRVSHKDNIPYVSCIVGSSNYCNSHYYL
jgi:hypothetical protein